MFSIAGTVIPSPQALPKSVHKCIINEKMNISLKRLINKKNLSLLKVINYIPHWEHERAKMAELVQSRIKTYNKLYNPK